MRTAWGAVLGLVLLGLNGCGGRAVDGRVLPDAGPGTPCANDCDCGAMLACLGGICTVADRYNRCCYSPYCPPDLGCVMPDGQLERCPDLVDCHSLDEVECRAASGSNCTWQDCPCSYRPSCIRDAVPCNELCPQLDCHAYAEVECRATPACQVATCPACDTEQFVACLNPGEPLPPCDPTPCPPPAICDDRGAGDCADYPGCTPVYCTDCQGRSTYAGCNGGPGPQVDCGSTPCPGADCRSQADCAAAGERCLAPGESPGCGDCFNPEVPCGTDADCGQSGIICSTVECACDGGTYCQPGCMSDDACAGDQFCSPDDFRCHPLACFTDSPVLACPIDHTCTEVGCAPGAIPCCQRHTCNVDSDCPAERDRPPGYCVNGLCYRLRGQCTPPPA